MTRKGTYKKLLSFAPLRNVARTITNEDGSKTTYRIQYGKQRLSTEEWNRMVKKENERRRATAPSAIPQSNLFLADIEPPE